MNPARATTRPTILDLVDTIGRGSTENWIDLYRRAGASPTLRDEIRLALRMLDPDTASARELWAFLLERIESAQLQTAEHLPVHEKVVSPHR